MTLAAGVQHLRNRQPADSLVHFRDAIRLFPDFYEAYYSIGLAELALLRYPEAIDAFQKAIDLSAGQYTPAAFAMGRSFGRPESWLKRNKRYGELWRVTPVMPSVIRA